MRNLLAALAVGIVFASGSANATEYLITATGAAVSGADQLGIFGTPNNDTTGESVTLKFTYDPSLGVSINNSTFIEQYGGAFASTPSPLLSASVTINGITKSEDVSYDDFIYEDTDNGYNVYATDVGGDNVQIFGMFSGLPIPLSLTTPFVATATGLIGQGDFLFSQNNVQTYANLSINQVVVTEIPGGSGAPEPEAWTMLFIGFFGLGTMVRCRIAAAIATA